ncbi:hypothetical protein Rumeso_03931 [Rubellimicrobium mesophilum DSM 19309]|uniref:Uncharacterized protein n=1 Tax=Rubellimicrobium mesophilum DSM 19309 TaxID=442562 RepID=A0A017HJY7_9RHOB|nr:hypothetical protein Rumeso_03931 [Rubellimicrobium mesophilum DSM 19309]
MSFRAACRPSCPRSFSRPRGRVFGGAALPLALCMRSAGRARPAPSFGWKNRAPRCGSEGRGPVS